MNSIFSICMGDLQNEEDNLTVVKPQPLKFKFAKGINMFDFLLKHFAQPKRIEKYTFQRNQLHFITTQNCHIPFLYFPSAFPALSIIMVYCHGSGSTLNNVRDYAYYLHLKFGIAILAYDYTGQGQSNKSFNSYEQDMKIILAWIVKQGYKLNRTIICGFSLGSYSALCIKGQMSRVLISPICGIIPFMEDKICRYEGEKYDNINLALERRVTALIFHCKKQFVPIEHGKILRRALQANNQQNEVVFHEITDQIYTHPSAPSYLLSVQGSRVLASFLTKVHSKAHRCPILKEQTKILLQQLSKIDYEQFSEQIVSKSEQSKQ